MKRAPSITFWTMTAVAGLTVVSALSWFSYFASRPVARVIPVPEIAETRTRISAYYVPLSRETAAIDDPESPPVNAAVPRGIESDEQGAGEVSRQVEIAGKLAGLRAELNAAADIADTQKRNETLAQICYHWGEFDPGGAVALACEFHLEEAGVLENLTQQWASVDLPAARAWIDAQPPSESRAHLVARVGFLWAQGEPESAANYILDQIPPGDIQAEAVISVLHQWAQQDRYAAMAWARQFPPGALRERALGETAQAVAQRSAD